MLSRPKDEVWSLSSFLGLLILQPKKEFSFKCVWAFHTISSYRKGDAKSSTFKETLLN